MKPNRLMLFLCAAILFLFAACGPKEALPADSPPPPTPRGGELVVTAAPGSTPTPVEPYAPPSGEATPAPDEQDSRLVDLSGSFRSETGTNLNLTVDWHCLSVNANSVKLTVSVYLESYSLSVGERLFNSLTVNGETYTFSTAALDVPGGDLSQTKLFDWSETLHLEPDVRLIDLSVAWNFDGSYSGVSLENIVAEGTLDLY